MTIEPLRITTHVGRDLLQSAALFKTEKAVVWEYVSNGLQYVDLGVRPIVRVRMNPRAKSIAIEDNGRGMSWEDLHAFFTMHGENRDRRQGRPGRGKWGTGKSAAFGIAEALRVTTVKDGRESVVELDRETVCQSEGSEIRPRELKREACTSKPNGTVIEIEKILLPRLDQAEVIRYIERQLAHWDRTAQVFVNNHLCEFHEPAFREEHRFESEGEFPGILGSAQLILKVSMAPLDEFARGVAIFANGVWLATTLAGSEGKEMSQYIFGEIDVPALDRDDDPIPAFDMSRSMRLNSNHPVVEALLRFIGPHVEGLRRRLVEEGRQQRLTAEARKLQRQALEIARIINEDFTDYARRVELVRARATGGLDGGRTNPAGDRDGPTEVLAAGGTTLASAVDVPATLESHPPRTPSPPREPCPEASQPVGKCTLLQDESGEATGQPRGCNGAARQPRGGFSVRFDHNGVASARAVYDASARSIIVNLDHPQVAAARGRREVDDPVFKRLAYEVAFSEYAIALASELDAKDDFADPGEAIYSIRETLNRVAVRAASLYRIYDGREA